MVKINFGGSIKGSDLEKCLEKTASDLNIGMERQVESYIPDSDKKELKPNDSVYTFSKRPSNLYAAGYARFYTELVSKLSNGADNTYTELSFTLSVHGVLEADKLYEKFFEQLYYNIVSSGKLIEGTAPVPESLAKNTLV
jgi:hypothetical protein